MSLKPEQVERYARHLVLKEIGGPGQAALLQSSVLIVGAGGLGAPVALYLAAAGIGRIGLVDDDQISLSNLQRQILFTTSMTGQSKVGMAAKRLAELNPDPVIETFDTRLTTDNAAEVLADFDIILDGCDNFPTRFLVNQTCHTLSKTLISGAVGRFDGQVSAHRSNPKPSKYDRVLPAATACYQCLVPGAPPDAETCEQVGVVGALTGIIGSIMALEAIKLITGSGETLLGRLLVWEGLAANSRTLNLPADPNCPVCGTP